MKSNQCTQQSTVHHAEIKPSHDKSSFAAKNKMTDSGCGGAGAIKYTCPRLIDYVLLVGRSRPRLTQPGSRICAPELLRRYPPDDHVDFPLPANVVFFCQPEGALTASGKRLAAQPPTSFVFALTDKDTNRVRYGVCLNFFRVIRRNHAHRAKRPTSQSNHLNPPDDNNNIEGNADQNQDNLAKVNVEEDTGESDATRSPIYSPLPGPTLQSKRSSRRSKSRTQLSSLNSICLITHHPFFASFRECLFAIKNMLQSVDGRSKNRHRNRRSSNRSSPSNTPINCSNCRNNNECDCERSGEISPDLWSVLTGNVTIDSPKVNEEVREQLRQLDTFIMRLLSAPIPIPGNTKIEVNKNLIARLFDSFISSLYLGNAFQGFPFIYIFIIRFAFNEIHIHSYSLTIEFKFAITKYLKFSIP